VLSQSGIVRSDIRSSFGQFSGTAEGILLTIRLTILDASNACAPLAGAGVYLWHCDRAGQYSLYTVTDQNYLRGVQAAGDDANKIAASQIAMPEDVCNGSIAPGPRNRRIMGPAALLDSSLLVT
jgi:hypothetical protein